jgi:putative ABC transport system permease protein
MFGVAWGLICLILMNAMNEGMWEAQKQKAKALGQNIMIVWGGTTSKGGQGVRAGRRIALTLDDYLLLKSRATHLSRLSPEIIRGMLLQSRLNNGSFDVHGVYPDYMEMRSIAVQPGGRLIHEGDNAGAQRVCILGDEVKEQLFEKERAVGESVMIGGLPYLVIGELVHKDQNSDYSGPDTRHVFLPFHAMARDFPITGAWTGKFQLSNLILQPSSAALGDAAELQARRLLAREKFFDPLDEDALPIWNTLT